MSVDYLEPVAGGPGCTRRHAIKVFAASAGGLILGSHLPRAWADLPWGESPRSHLLTVQAESRCGLRLAAEQRCGNEARQADPTILIGRRIWTSWTQLEAGREAVFLRGLSPADAAWSDPLLISDGAAGGDVAAGLSELVALDDRLIVVWLETAAGGWTLKSRVFDSTTGRLGDIHVVAGGPDNGHHLAYPALAAGLAGILVVWQERVASSPYGIFGRLLDRAARPADEVIPIAVPSRNDACRPALAASPDNSTYYVAYDRQEGPGTQNICLAEVDARRRTVGRTIRLSQHPASDLAPALAWSPDGNLLWAAWHTNRREDASWDISRWIQLVAYEPRTGKLRRPAGGVEEPHRDSRDTVQGFELVRLAVSSRGVVCVLGRASHAFYVQYFSAQGRSELYRLPKEGWGGRGRLLRGAFDEQGALWLARRDIGQNVLARIDGFTDLAGPPPLEELPSPLNASAYRRLPPLQGRAPRHRFPDLPEKFAHLNVYFGDIHGHSWQSDGMGDPAESFLRARDVLADDFHALTDHDHFVAKRLNDSQWAHQKALVEHYHQPGKFVTLFGQEWTTPRVGRPHGWGHFDIYSADPAIPLFDHTDDRWRDLPDLYAALRPYDALAIPHHIGWTGVPWDAVDPDLTPVVEICSVHGAFEYEGNEPIRHRGGMKGCFYRDGLARGLRVGVVGASDQHGLTWHHGVCWKRNVFRAGLTGVYAPELTRVAILDAVRNRHTFATTGVKLHLLFTVNDELMGGEIASDEPPRIRVEVAVPPEEGRLAWIETVRDGQVIHRYGGEGQRSTYTFVDETMPEAQTFSYYLRLILADHNMAWSSPVWLTRGHA